MRGDCDGHGVFMNQNEASWRLLVGRGEECPKDPTAGAAALSIFEENTLKRRIRQAHRTTHTNTIRRCALLYSLRIQLFAFIRTYSRPHDEY